MVSVPLTLSVGMNLLRFTADLCCGANKNRTCELIVIRDRTEVFWSVDEGRKPNAYTVNLKTCSGDLYLAGGQKWTTDGTLDPECLVLRLLLLISRSEQ